MVIDIKLKFIEKILVIYVIIIISGCIQKSIDLDREFSSLNTFLLNFLN